jgi:oligopeptide transport system substrate-binding protein
MKGMTIRLFPSVLTGLLALSLAGCTRGKDKVKVENVLHLPLITDARTFDPAGINDMYSGYVASLVYEGLLEYHYLKRPHELQPLLAESMPDISADGLTYTFHLRKGVRFTDHPAFPGGKGRELRARDFIYSFLRIADPKGRSGNFWIFDGRVKGLNEWREQQKKAPRTDFDTPPEGFAAPDDSTLVIRLNQKYAQLLFVLAMPAAYVVPREVVEATGEEFTNIPVGTGPYKLVRWTRNSRLSFVRNPDFRGQEYPSEGAPGDRELGLLDDAGKKLPFADRVEYMVFVESQPRWLNFLKGALDYGDIPKDNFPSAVDAKTRSLLPEIAAKGIALTKAPQDDLSFVAFNVEDPVIKKGGPNLRKAISLALDQNRKIELLFNNRAVVAQFIIPPTIAGFDPAYVNPFIARNLDKAREYLKKAGYPEGKGLPELVYDVGDGSESRQLAEMMQRELAEIGVRLRVNMNQFSELSEKVSQRRVQLYGMAWGADYPDAENFLQLLYGPNAAPGPNGSNFNNAEYNRLYVQVRDMLDSPERRALIAKMRDIFTEEMPLIPERHRISYTLSQGWLKNYKPEYMGSSIAKYLRVDLERKAQGMVAGSNAAPGGLGTSSEGAKP